MTLPHGWYPKKRGEICLGVKNKMSQNMRRSEMTGVRHKGHVACFLHAASSHTHLCPHCNGWRERGGRGGREGERERGKESERWLERKRDQERERARQRKTESVRARAREKDRQRKRKGESVCDRHVHRRGKVKVDWRRVDC